MTEGKPAEPTTMCLCKNYFLSDTKIKAVYFKVWQVQQNLKWC